MYEYHANLVRVVDGDTVDVRLDLGLGIYKNERLRLHGIDAPEKRGEERVEGIEATRHLELLLKGPLLVQTIKDKKGKYGRYLAVIYDQEGVNINSQMIEDGHATLYE
jgi:micrococcal nuclease